MKFLRRQKCTPALRSRSPALPETVLEFSNVSVAPGGEPVLHNLSFAVRRGEFVWISGHNGSGKSTILRTIEGLEHPIEGQVEVFGQDVHQLTQAKREKLFAARLGMGFQTPSLTKNASPIENMRDFAESTGRKNSGTNARIARIVGSLGLESKMHEPTVAHLSGGEQQRLALGALLVTAPELLLLDEPTGMLDDGTKQSVFQMLRQTVDEENTTILMVSHDKPEAGIVDRQIDIQAGRIHMDVAAPLIFPAQGLYQI